MYDFFTLYADVDGWEWNGDLSDPSADLKNPLDQWIVSRVHQLTQEIDDSLSIYDLPNATKPILPFLDDASNWYVRRSRKRFWKSDDDADKNDAYRTLHYVLVRLSVVLAPFTPFLAEELYHKLTGGESVHLLDWPETGTINEFVVKDMALTRRVIELGLAQRMAKTELSPQIKVRQPLSSITYTGTKLSDDFELMIAEEVNVKTVTHDEGYEGESLVVSLDKNLTPELIREGLAREVIRNVQSARKTAGLEVDDRIVLALLSKDEELRQAMTEYQNAIMTETLANEYVLESREYAFVTDCKIEGKELVIGLQKA